MAPARERDTVLSGNMSQFIEITIGPDTSERIGVVSIDETIAAEIRRVGREPSEFNRMRWPIGAASWGCGRFLLHGDDLAIALTDTSQPVPFQFGGIEFESMLVRSPRPLFVSEGSRAVFELEVVCDRFGWSDESMPVGLGFNVTTPDKSTFYTATLAEGGELWTPP